MRPYSSSKASPQPGCYPQASFLVELLLCKMVFTCIYYFNYNCFQNSDVTIRNNIFIQPVYRCLLFTKHCKLPLLQLNTHWGAFISEVKNSVISNFSFLQLSEQLTMEQLPLSRRQKMPTGSTNACRHDMRRKKRLTVQGQATARPVAATDGRIGAA